MVEIDKDRYKSFNQIFSLLVKDGFSGSINNSPLLVTWVSRRYKDRLAQKILDLYFARDIQNRGSIYYQNDVAFEVACEMVSRELKSKLDIYRYDDEFVYKESAPADGVFGGVVSWTKSIFRERKDVGSIEEAPEVSPQEVSKEKKKDDSQEKKGKKEEKAKKEEKSPAKEKKSVTPKKVKKDASKENKSVTPKKVKKEVSKEKKSVTPKKVVKEEKSNKEYQPSYDDIDIYTKSYSSTTLSDGFFVDMIESIFSIIAIVLKFIFYDMLIWLGSVLSSILSFSIYIVWIVLFIYIGKFFFDISQSNGKKTESQISTPAPKAIQHSVVKEQRSRVVKPKTTLSKCQYYVPKTNLNIRASKSTSSSKVGRVKKGEKLCITNKQNGWYYIKSKGWVASRYLNRYHKVTPKKKRVQKKVTKKQKVKKPQVVWHCIAKSVRASGWADNLNQSRAKTSALHQCEIRRVSDKACQIVSCTALK